MELILALIFLFFGGAILRGIFAAGNTVVTGKSFSESYTGIPDFGLRLKEQPLSDEPDSPLVMAIEMKGPIPSNRSGNIGCIITLLDISVPDEKKPVLCMLDFQQEEGSRAFKSYQEFGYLESGGGFTDWVRIGGFFPEMLQVANSGDIKLQVNVLLVNANNPPETALGFVDDVGQIYWSQTLEHRHHFEEKGYLEAAEHRDEAQALTVKLGVAVAMADGSLDEAEGMVIKNWIEKTISAYSDDKKEELKSLYNAAFKSAFEESQVGQLSLSVLSVRLNEIGEKKLKYDAYDLANEVMAADGVADSEELRVIRVLGEALELDTGELEQIRSKHIMNLEDAFASDNSLEELLGIDPSWSTEKIKAHLASEFQKWNGRYNSLAEGNERDNAQNILNRIGEARKKYDVV